MGSLSGLFDLTRSALTADQAALSATSNNVANQNTAGYTRQIVSFTAGDTVTLNSTGSLSNQVSSGPTVTTTSVRDRVLDQRIQQQTQAQSASASQAAILSQVEDVFSITGTSSSSAGSTQIATAMDSFFSSLTALATSPSDTATRDGVLSSAQVLAGAFNSAASQLVSIATSINGEISSSVSQVNALSSTIAQLNGQIASTSPNTDAGTLEDQRQLAITQLSALVGLDQITTQGNGMTLTTQGGTVLVSGSTANALSAAEMNGSTAILDESGHDVTATVQGGSIGGQILAQNSSLPAIALSLDSVAYRVASAVNAQNEAGLDGTGAAGAAIFAIGSSAPGAASTIAVIPTSATAIAAASTGEGLTGSGNANALASLQTTPDAGGLTMSGEFGALISQVGSDASALSQQSTVQQASLTQLSTQQSSLSGVSLDDEAANLSQYQRAYEAAAKVMSVLDALMADSINLGTETTVT